MQKSDIYLSIIFIIIMGIFYFSLLKWLVESWLNNAYYSHGFIIPIISGFIIWNKRNELLKTERKRSQIGLVIFMVGIALYGVAFITNARFVAGLSLIVTIFGITLYLFGYRFTNKIRFPILFLLLAIPIPPFIDLVALPIQTFSAVSVTSLANLIGMSVQRNGLQLNIPAGTFEVALECSGLNSIISLLTISIIFAYILEGSLLKKYIIILSSIPLAMIGNIIRIISVIFIANKYGQSVALDYFHESSSLLLFSIAFIGLFVVGRCFGRLRFKI